MDLNKKVEVFSNNIDFQQNLLDNANTNKSVSTLISEYNERNKPVKAKFFFGFNGRVWKFKKLAYKLKASLKSRDYAKAINLLEENYTKLNSIQSEKLLKLFSGRKARLLLLANIFKKPSLDEKIEATGKALYFLFNSYPYSDNGYAIRSHGIAKALVGKGLDLEVITRAGYPFDVKKSFHHDDLIGGIKDEDGVSYNRVFWPKRYQSFHNYNSYKTEEYLWLSMISYMGILEKKKPKVVIAASNYLTALPVYLAAKLLSIPFIYDIRGFWELTESSRNKNYENSEAYKIDSFIEQELIKNSTYAFAISKSLKVEIENNLNEIANIRLLLNGAEAKPKIHSVINKRSLVLGFFGALNDYEGLDDLLRSIHELINEGFDITLKIIGGQGAKSFNNKKTYHEQLLDLVENLKLSDNVKFIDKVKFQALPQFYKNVDLVVIPRKDWEVCNLITPLKLIEAMSFGKAVLASNVNAISENIMDGDNGYLFKKGNIESLKQKLKDIYLDRDKLLSVSNNAYSWFLKNRTWDTVVSDLVNVINRIDDSRIESVVADTSLLEEVAIYKKQIGEYTKERSPSIQGHDQDPLKVVFILHSSLPYLSGGYATRAHGLIKGIKRSGVDVFPYTRPGFPYDLKRKNLKIKFPLSDDVDDIIYRRISSEINRLEYDEKIFMWESIEEYKKIFAREKPSIVHGRSTYLVSLPAYIAALSLGIPFVYEVSGLWELVFESRDDAADNIQKIQRIRALETLVMQGAHQVLTLTVDMRAEIVSRGVDENKVTLVPNSVDINKFVKVDRDLALQRKIGLDPDDFVFGYIGSFVEYEGLDDLIYAFDKVAKEIPKAKLLLVGSGNVKNKIIEIAQRSTNSNKIIILDRIPHEEVLNYYSLLDVVVFARKGWDVCEKVSPMKPFEAMACEKVVLSSSVKALRDIVNNNVTGFVFEKDSVEDLSLNLKKLYFKKSELKQIGKTAREWVVENRSWDKAGQEVLSVYRKIHS